MICFGSYSMESYIKLERWQSNKALRDDLVVPSATTLSTICRRYYELTVDAINEQFASQNELSSASDRWTSTNKLAITSVIAYYSDRNWALREVQLASNKVDCLFLPRFESKFRLIGQAPTYWSKGSNPFDGSSWSFKAYQQPVGWDYDWYCLLKLHNDTRATINTWGLCRPVARIEEPHTFHGAHHTAGIRCIHEQSWCPRVHQVLGSPWTHSTIWKEWKRRHGKESKASKRGQL